MLAALCAAVLTAVSAAAPAAKNPNFVVLFVDVRVAARPCDGSRISCQRSLSATALSRRALTATDCSTDTD